VSDPTPLLDFFAAVMLAVSAYCAARLLLVRHLHRSLHYDVNVAHVVMGVAMAGMLAPALNALGDTAWEVIFAGLAAWFTAKSARFIARHGVAGRSNDHIHGISHYLTHLVMAGAMLYMYLAAGTSITTAHATGMVMAPAAGTADIVALPLLFIVVLAASAVAHIDALGRFSPVRLALASTGARATDGPATSTSGGELQWLSPRLEMGCHIAMCVAMAFMLVLTI
jgi:hypothetical protein